MPGPGFEVIPPPGEPPVTSAVFDVLKMPDTPATPTLTELDLSLHRPFVDLGRVQSEFIKQGLRSCWATSQLNAILARGETGLTGTQASVVLQRLLTAPEYAALRHNESGMDAHWGHPYPFPVALEVFKQTGQTIRCTHLTGDEARSSRIGMLVSNLGFIAALGAGSDNPDGGHFVTLLRPNNYQGIAVIDPRLPHRPQFIPLEQSFSAIANLQNGAQMATIF